MAEPKKALYLSGRPIGFVEGKPVYAEKSFADGLQHAVELFGGAKGVLPDFVSSTYTPALFNTTNVAASTAYEAFYQDLGGLVHVYAKIDIDPAAAGQVVLGVSLPVASNLMADHHLIGTGAAIAVAGLSVGIHADTTNDRAVVEFIAVDTANRSFYLHFSYRKL